MIVYTKGKGILKTIPGMNINSACFGKIGMLPKIDLIHIQKFNLFCVTSQRSCLFVHIIGFVQLYCSTVFTHTQEVFVANIHTYFILKDNL